MPVMGRDVNEKVIAAAEELGERPEIAELRAEYAEAVARLAEGLVPFAGPVDDVFQMMEHVELLELTVAYCGAQAFDRWGVLMVERNRDRLTLGGGAVSPVQKGRER